jgi:uncharacterized protein
MLDKRTIISRLNLEPHPEGGFFKRTITTGNDGTGRRLTTTCIHFLIDGNNSSSLHKIDVDEYWMYHCGTSDIFLKGFSADGESDAFTLQMGHSCMQWQHLVPKNTWFGAKTVNETEDAYALVSCICTPGFDFSGFVLGDRNSLINTYPKHIQLIKEMSP